MGERKSLGMRDLTADEAITRWRSLCREQWAQARDWRGAREIHIVDADEAFITATRMALVARGFERTLQRIETALAAGHGDACPGDDNDGCLCGLNALRALVTVTEDSVRDA